MELDWKPTVFVDRASTDQNLSSEREKESRMQVIKLWLSQYDTSLLN
jgi:hypothetical protein